MNVIKDLYRLALSDQTVESILRASIDHQQATRELNERGYDFSRTSVRRAREKMNVVSPKSPAVFEDQKAAYPAFIPPPQPSSDETDVQTFVVLPDFQCDLQDDSFLYRAHELVRYVAPDGIIHVGDENDASSISRWTKDTPDEHVPEQLQRQVDVTYKWLKKFRDIPSVRDFQVCFSNHGARFGVSLRTRVPGWKDMRVVQYDHIMREAAWHHGDEPLDIDFDVHLVEMIPGTVAGHGDQWNLTSKSQYTQMSDVARDLGRNVIAGHTHRPLLSTVSYRDSEGVQRSRFIMNVGHAMDVRQAEYTLHYRGKTPQWGQAVGIVTVVNGVAFPELVQDHNGSMLYKGILF